MQIIIIVAAAENGVIGKDNDIPWHLPEDLKYFKRTTMDHHIIMGRKTFESIGKALPGRTSIVVTRSQDFKAEGAIVANDVKEAIEVARKAGESQVFVIGGATIYRQVLPETDAIYITRVHARIEGDTSFPVVKSDNWKLVASEEHKQDDKNPYDYTFERYERVRATAEAEAN